MRGSVTRSIYFKAKPKDAVTWLVVPSVTSVAVRRSGASQVPDVAYISVTVTRQEGAGAPQTVSDDEWSTYLIDVWYRYTGESTWKMYPFAPGITVNTEKKGIEIRLTIANVEYYRVSVPFTFDGATGPQGGRGAILRGPRDWSEVSVGAQFQNGADGCEFFDVVVYNGSFFSCKTTHTKTLSNYPGSDVAQTNQLWQAASDLQFVATKLLLAEYALIKNLGVEALEMADPDNPELLQCVIKDGAITIRKGQFHDITVQSSKLTDCRVSGVLTATQLWLGCEDGSTVDLTATTEPKGALLVNPTTVKLPSLVAGTSRSIRILYPKMTSGATSLTLYCASASNTKIHLGMSGEAQTSLTIQSSTLMAGKMYECLGVSTNANTEWYIIEL